MDAFVYGIKLTFAIITALGLLYGYYVLFWDEDWEWHAGELIVDFFKTIILLVIFLLVPWRFGAFFREMGPVRFLVTFVLLTAGMGWAIMATLGNGPVVANAVAETAPPAQTAPAAPPANQAPDPLDLMRQNIQRF